MHIIVQSIALTNDSREPSLAPRRRDLDYSMSGCEEKGRLDSKPIVGQGEALRCNSFDSVLIYTPTCYNIQATYSLISHGPKLCGSQPLK